MPVITTTDGVEIFYKDWGSGQPIVFSHGWPLSADDWDAQMLFFVSQGFRVIAHDRRGHGRSAQVGEGFVESVEVPSEPVGQPERVHQPVPQLCIGRRGRDHAHVPATVGELCGHRSRPTHDPVHAVTGPGNAEALAHRATRTNVA